MQEDIIDDYDGKPSQSYNFCKLGYKVQFISNMEQKSSQDKVLEVFRQLNTQIGSELPAKPAAICKQAELSVLEAKKIIGWLKHNSYLKTIGKAAGTKYFMIKKVDTLTPQSALEALSFHSPVRLLSTGKLATREQKDSAKSKQYFLGQQVYTLHDNSITIAIISKMAIREGARVDNVTNALIDYTLLIQGDTSPKELKATSLDFSDTIDGLLSLIKYKYTCNT